MFTSNNLLVFCLIITTAVPVHVHFESDVGFPEREHLDIERNNTRIPLYIPGKCPQNQLLYPGDQKNDWICDCRPGYLYYAPLDGCYEAYRQGPCQGGHYLILEQGDFNPSCARNTCNVDGAALYNAFCYALYKEGGPCKLQEGGGIFGVNSTTLTLECLKGTDRLSVIQISGSDCTPGSQRDRNNKCKRRDNNK